MGECGNPCRMEERIRQLEDKATKNSDDHKEFYNRFENISLNNQRHDMLLKSFDEKLDGIALDVKELKEKPLNRGDKFTSAVITAIGSSIGTGILFLVVYGLIRSFP